MIALFLYFIAIPVGVFILLWLFRVRSKKFLLGIPILIFCLPFILGGSLYLLRTPIQQGKFLSDFGPLLSWAFPAKDLYIPLAEGSLKEYKDTYLFKVSHKYLGRHAVLIEIPSKDQPDWATEDSLSLSVEISEDNHTIFQGSSDQGSPYMGMDKYGYYYVGYKVPENVPVAKELTIQIKVEKDINEFLNKHNDAKLVVKKMSDE
jgi:hypothetical protein